MVQDTYKILSNEGIHARPATELINEGSRFSCEITLGYKDKKVNLKSVLGVLSLGIPKDAVITLSYDGVDEEEASKSVKEHLLSKKTAELIIAE